MHTVCIQYTVQYLWCAYTECVCSMCKYSILYIISVCSRSKQTRNIHSTVQPRFIHIIYVHYIFYTSEVFKSNNQQYLFPAHSLLPSSQTFQHRNMDIYIYIVLQYRIVQYRIGQDRIGQDRIEQYRIVYCSIVQYCIYITFSSILCTISNMILLVLRIGMTIIRSHSF